MYYTLYFLYTVFLYCSYTIFIYLYSCTVHFLYCFPVILFIWLSLLCTCICCHIFSYDIPILCFSYAFLYTMLFIYYIFHMIFIYFICHIHFVSLTLYFLYLYTCHTLFSFIYFLHHILSSCALLFVLVTVYTFIA